MTDEELAKQAENLAKLKKALRAGGKPAERHSYAHALESAGRMDDALDTLLEGQEEPSIRERIWQFDPPYSGFGLKPQILWVNEGYHFERTSTASSTDYDTERFTASYRSLAAFPLAIVAKTRERVKLETTSYEGPFSGGSTNWSEGDAEWLLDPRSGARSPELLAAEIETVLGDAVIARRRSKTTRAVDGRNFSFDHDDLFRIPLWDMRKKTLFHGVPYTGSHRLLAFAKAGLLLAREGDPSPLWFERSADSRGALFSAEPLRGTFGPKIGEVAVAGDLAILVTSSERGRTLHAVDLVRGEEFWRQDLGSGPDAFRFLLDPAGWVAAVSGELSSFDRSGRKLWSRKAPAAPLHLGRSALAVEEGGAFFIVHRESGERYALPDSLKGATPMTFSGDRLVVGHGLRLIAFGAEGKKAWQLDLPEAKEGAVTHLAALPRRVLATVGGKLFCVGSAPAGHDDPDRPGWTRGGSGGRPFP